MLLFSELTDVNVETSIIESLRYSKITPPSFFVQLKTAIRASIEQHTPDTNRFSFLSSKTSILPCISPKDLQIIKPKAFIIDTRTLEQYFLVA
jgi:hypothetical protein